MCVYERNMVFDELGRDGDLVVVALSGEDQSGLRVWVGEKALE